MKQKTYISWLSRTVSTGRFRGSNHVSLRLRKLIERIPFKQILGLNLAGLAFAAAVVAPQANDVAANFEVFRSTEHTMIDVVPTESQYQWPLSRFAVSQNFYRFHPGLDLAADGGTPIFPIADGRIIAKDSLRWGYGNHVIVEHKNGTKSLYAHLSKFNVRLGEEVTKATKIGEVGSTGRSTGNHLHMEVYEKGAPINPINILPDLPAGK